MAVFWKKQHLTLDLNQEENLANKKDEGDQ